MDVVRSLGQRVQIVSTLAVLKALAGTATRDIYVQGRASDGDGYAGQFRWDSSDLSTEVTADTQNGVYVPPDSDNTGASGAWVREYVGAVNVRWFGVAADGTDERAEIQAALDFSDSVIFQAGVYGVGDSGSTVAYRSSTAIIGLALNTDQDLIFEGRVTFKPTAVDVCPIVADSKTNLRIGDFFIDGDTSLAHSSDRHFGAYFLDCTGLKIGNTDIREVYSNTLEVIGCTLVEYAGGYHLTTAANSIGGGPQFEDCTGVMCGPIFGSTFDDLVSVIAHATDVEDHDFLMVQGKSEEARTFFIGQSGTAVGGPHTISSITANIESRGSGLSGSGSPAFTLFREGRFHNLNIKVVDYGSWAAARINPYEGVENGRLYNSIFDITSYNAQKFGVEVNHNGDSSNVIEHNKLVALVSNPNKADTDIQHGVIVQSGDFWDIDVNIDYRPGKTNVGTGLVLGAAADADSSVRTSRIRGLVDGGDLNIDVKRAKDSILDGLVCENTENANDTSINVSSDCDGVRLGTVRHEGEVLDQSGSMQRLADVLCRDSSEVDTGGATIETDLMSYTIPADYMAKTGVVRVKASGRITGTAGNKTLTFYWGTTTHELHAAANDEGYWSAEIVILQGGDRSSQLLDINCQYNNATLLISGEDDSEDSTLAIPIKFTGEAADAADIVSQRTLVIGSA